MSENAKQEAERLRKIIAEATKRLRLLRICLALVFEAGGPDIVGKAADTLGKVVGDLESEATAAAKGGGA